MKLFVKCNKFFRKNQKVMIVFSNFSFLYLFNIVELKDRFELNTRECRQ